MTSSSSAWAQPTEPQPLSSWQQVDGKTKCAFSTPTSDNFGTYGIRYDPYSQQFCTKDNICMNELNQFQFLCLSQVPDKNVKDSNNANKNSSSNNPANKNDGMMLCRFAGVPPIGVANAKNSCDCLANQLDALNKK